MRPVYAVSGGVSKFAKARPDKTFPALVKEAYDYAIADLGLTHRQFIELVDGSVAVQHGDATIGDRIWVGVKDDAPT